MIKKFGKPFIHLTLKVVVIIFFRYLERKRDEENKKFFQF